MSANRCAACDTHLDGRGSYMTADGTRWCDKHIGDAPKYEFGEYTLRATRDVERGQIATTADVTLAPKREPRVGDVYCVSPSGAEAECIHGGQASMFRITRSTPMSYPVGAVVPGTGVPLGWTLVSEAPAAPEALPPSAGRDFLAATYAKAAERFVPQPEAPRSEPADWRKAWPIGTECEVNADSWGGNGWHRTRVMAWEGTAYLVVKAVDGSGAYGRMSSALESNFRPLRTEPVKATVRRIDEEVVAAFEMHFRAFPSRHDPFVPVMPAAGFLPTDVPFGPGTPAAGIRACPFCTHALHTAHTSAVLRCAACGWAGTEAQRAAACEPVRAESRFKVGDRVRVWNMDVYEWCGGAAPGQLMERETDGTWLYIDTMLGSYDSEPEARSAAEADIWSEAEWYAMSEAQWKAEAEKRMAERPA